MKDSADERASRAFFERLGFFVERLPPRSAEKSPDFRLRLGADKYIVEVKHRADDETARATLLDGGMVERENKIDRLNGFSKLIREGVAQLRSHEEPDEPLRLLWFFGRGREALTHMQQFEATFYGTVQVIQQREGKHLSIPCFFFTFNEAHRHPELDGVVVSSLEQGRLCLNPFSSRIERLRRSSLAQTFGDDGVVDSEVWEKAGSAFIADGKSDRHDEPGTLDYLRDKYNDPHLLHVHFKQLSMEVAEAFMIRRHKST